MKREALERHLRRNGCDLVREGARHSIWRHLETRETAPVPRHREVDDRLARAICEQLGIPLP